MGKWLPILSRVVTKTVFGDDPDRHWNVVQNNGMYASYHISRTDIQKRRNVPNILTPGIRAAQVVPHVHFHIIPRPSTYAAKPGFAMFGRGQREELDDDEGAELAHEMRAELAKEVMRVQREEGVDLNYSPVETQKRVKL